MSSTMERERERERKGDNEEGKGMTPLDAFKICSAFVLHVSDYLGVSRNRGNDFETAA
jgi:hypothetical protein